MTPEQKADLRAKKRAGEQAAKTLASQEQADADAAAAAAAKAARDETDRREADRLATIRAIRRAKELNAEQVAMRNAAIHRVHRDFTARPPAAFSMQGVFEPSRNERATADELPVPDGTYRLLGIDLLYEFRGGKLFTVSRADGRTASESYTHIPAPIA